MNYRRVFSAGGTYFFTLVTYQRRPIFNNSQAIEMFQSAIQYTFDRHPFTMVASVILPDHMHFIWTLPPDDIDYSTRWRLIKSHFTHHWCPKEKISQFATRATKGQKDVWQSRFWEHLIRDEKDLYRHIEYIHFNPVKHGLVNSPSEWKYSSFDTYLRSGVYPKEWGKSEDIWNGYMDME